MVKPPEILGEVRNQLPNIEYLRTLRNYEETRKKNNVTNRNIQPKSVPNTHNI